MPDSERAKAQLIEELEASRGCVAEFQSQVAYQRNSEDAAQKVPETERLFRQLADNASGAFWLFNADRRELLYVSPAYETIWGRSVASLYANPHSFLDAIHPHDRDVVAGDLTAQLAETFNDPFVQEYRVVRPDHSVRWVSTRYVPIRNEKGDVHRIAGISSDITDRKQAEIVLRRSEARLRAILETAVDAIITISLEGIITSFNVSAERMFGYTAEEAVGKNVRMLVPEPDATNHDAFMQRYLTTGETKIIGTRRELVAKRKDGITIPIELSVSDMHGAGEPGFTGLIRDITERKQAEELLQQRQKELAHVTRLCTTGEMIAQIVHEINQPLYSITNFAKACSQTLKGSPDGRDQQLLRWTSRIENTAQTAGKIINRLKKFVRDAESHRSRVDINTIIAETIELVGFDAHDHKVIVQFEPVEPGPKVVVDRIQIEQVVVNLLKNAFEAIEGTGEANRRVTVHTAVSDGSAEVIIEDTGPGISAESAGKLFDAFFTTKSDGMGMGLAVSRSIIEDHGGTIGAVSDRERGAAFHFTLPLSTA